MDRLVIVGGGGSGHACAYALRQAGFSGNITVLGKEPSPPYERPTLSENLFTDDAVVYLDPPLQDLDVAWIPGVGAQRLKDAHTLLLDSGEDLSFDHLIIATGASPRPPWPVASLNDLADLRHLDWLTSTGQSSTQTRVAVIGGSWLGAELVSAFDTHHPQISLDWYTRSPVLSGQLPAAVLARIAPWFAAHKLHDAKQITAADHSSITLGQREESYDIVLGALGVIPNTGWLSESVLGGQIDDAGFVQTNSHGKVPGFDHIYALGDCTGRSNHWQPALLQAEVLAANILNPAAAASLETITPYSYTKIWGNDLTVTGAATPELGSHVLFAERGGPDQWVGFHVDENDQLLGVITCNSPRDVARARRIFRQMHASEARAYQISADSLSTAPGKW